MRVKTKNLPKGIRYNKGIYEARKMVKGRSIYLSNKNLDQLIADFERAVYQAKNNIDYRMDLLTLNDWFDEWFTTYKIPQIKETSIYPMKRSFARTFGFYLGEERLNTLMPKNIQTAINAMNDHGIAISTIRDSLGRLRECMDAAVANRLIPSNPCIRITVPWVYKSTEEEVALTEEEQALFLKALKDSWYRELFFFMFLTGVRVGEMGAVKWSDIDFDKKTIHIRRSLSCAYNAGVKQMGLVTPKTACSNRQIPFIGEMEEILKMQKAKTMKLKKELGDRWRSTGEFDDLVFVSTMGSPCTRYIVDKEVKKVLKRMSDSEAMLAVHETRKPQFLIRDFHPHSIRHTFATRCAERDIDVKVAQKLLGHSNITITLNIYMHVAESRKMKEIEKFGDACIEDTQEKDIKLRISDKAFY